MDFYEIGVREPKSNKLEVYPDFIIDASKDMMIRGRDVYAVWDEELGLWNRNPLVIQKMVDRDIQAKIDELRDNPLTATKAIVGRFLRKNSSKHWSEFQAYVKNMPDNYRRLDEKVTYLDTKVKKTDYVSKRLPYSLQDGPAPAWEEIISTLYDPEEREKIEWAIGAILSGEAKRIQKFLVFYGPQGSGKSTILNIIMKLMEGYCVSFKAENLVKGNDQFNLDFLAKDPLVAIDEDTKLNHIESNALLNTLVSHEPININEKFIRRYPSKPICMLLMGTNQPVRITDAKSGLIRRLIDVEPSGRLILPERHYDELNEQIEFELGAIAKHCLDVFNTLGRTYYSSYVPERMMYRTDPFINFMEEKSDIFLKNGGVSGIDLWNMWKDYCSQSGIEFTKKRFEIIDEAKNYFTNFDKVARVGGVQVRSWFSGLKLEKFSYNEKLKGKNRNVEPIAHARLKEKLDDTYSEETKEIFSNGWLKLKKQHSLLDDILAEYPAQYEITTEKGETRPDISWKRVKTKLKDLDSTKTHYVKGPGQLIFIDFDKHGPDGKKDLKLNLKEAGSSKWPPTYSELSNSGGGIHSYYWYDGDVHDLSSVYSNEIEVKVFPEDQLRSIRRRVSMCNDLTIAHISSGLPLKEKKVINWDGVKDDRHLRNMVIQALKKECRPYGEEPKTITCVKYIRDVLQQAIDKGMSYDIRDLDEAIYAFAANSSNNKEECINIYYDMELMWPKQEEPTGNILDGTYKEDAPIIILDCEVVKNLTLIVYKELGPDKKCIRLYNPKPIDIERLMEMRIVGHNVTGYDNFILWAVWLGYTPEQVFAVSQDIIMNGNRMPWREAKNLSYTDTYDVSSDKKGLKKIEIEMHIPHKEMEIDWNQPLPESEWERLAQYCENDVLATEAYFMSDKWQADFKARKILAALTGMTVNDSTNSLTAQLIFGNVKEPWHEFIYPDLKAEFPGYRFERGKSYYEHKVQCKDRVEYNQKLEELKVFYGKDANVVGDEATNSISVEVIVGEGGRVYAEPGMYYDVITFDVAGMHPTSIIAENGFGPFTKLYKDLYEARIAIKHRDYEAARKMFDGRLAPYLESNDDADALSQALKIALNSVYGMTAAHFQNRFKDPRNIDNWVAKRGALFMEKLRLEVQKMGGHVIHIKTDSIKLVNPTKKLQDFVVNFGKEHGYTFEVESKYERICLVNHAVYIALRQKDDPGWLKECAKAKKKADKNGTIYIEPTRWTATGAQFAHPFVFKRLFSKEKMEFWDFCETKTVKTSLYLDINEKRRDVSAEEKERAKIVKRIKDFQKAYLNETKENQEKIEAETKDLEKDIKVLDEIIAEGHNYVFVGKAGEFMPIKPGLGGGLLMRSESDGTYGYATGAKGYRWLESETVHDLPNWETYIDLRYFKDLVDVAIETVSKFGDFELFVNGEEGLEQGSDLKEFETDPWVLPCGTMEYAYCSDCPDFQNTETGYSCKRGYTITKQILGE